MLLAVLFKTFFILIMNSSQGTEPNFQNSLYFWDSEILFVSWENISWFTENSFHKLHAALIIIPINQNSEIIIEDGSRIKYSGLIVPPNVNHRNEVMNAHVLILQIDPDSIYFNSIRTLLDKGITTFDSKKISNLEERVRQIIREETSCSEVLSLKESILANIQSENQISKPHKPLDNRVLLAVDYLKNLPDLTEDTSLTYLSKLVGLSQDRFRHLFSENMGISIRRYILYLRIKKTAFYLSQGFNLTRAAHNSGFADLAHLSRTFREMYGNNPSSMFLKESKIKFHFCDNK